MNRLTEVRAKIAKTVPFQVLPPQRWARQRPTYREASPAVIGSALRRSQRRASGNWYPFAASRDVGSAPLGATVAGIDVVAWRGDGEAVHVGPRACPHLGADLSTGRVDGAALVCPWHGLRLSGCKELGWKPFPAFDDGVLTWVRLDAIGGEPPTDAPILPPRPGIPRLSAVASLVGTCEPSDVIANRMDPWHGSWFHPYSFTRLDVLDAPPPGDDVPEELDRFLVAVTFRIGRLGVPVVAEFTSPEPRTITMRIVDGEGAGSVVETHAVPVGLGADGLPRTKVIEAVIAHSDRPHFGLGLYAAPLIRPLMERSAARLWRDDLVYAERIFAIRNSTS